MGRPTPPNGRPRSKNTYSLGVSRDLTDHVTAYVNRKKTFEIGSRITRDAIVAGESQHAGFYGPPVDGQSTELGLKFNLLDDRLQLTTSVYRATQTNVLQNVGIQRGLPAFELLPTTLSKGLEIDVAGRMAKGWNLTGSVSYNDFSYAKPTSGNADISQFPHVATSLWSTYEFQRPDLRGWGYGLGVFYRSSYASGVGYRVPGQARVDASVFYKADKWSATLGVKNLFNRTLYSNFAIDTVSLEPRRTLTLSATYNF